MILILVAIGFIGSLYLYLRETDRTERAEAKADRLAFQAKQAKAEARRYRRDAINARNRLSKYLLSEDEQIASMPAEVAPITDVDQFLGGLFGGRA